MLPAGHEDRLSSLIDAPPLGLPEEPEQAVPMQGPRSRILAQGRIIGHILPLIATAEDPPSGSAARSLMSEAYDEM